MSLLFALLDGERVIGQCDARCYDAAAGEPACDCVCGGRNHGLGLERAVALTHRELQMMVAAYAQARGLRRYRLQVGESLRTLAGLLPPPKLQAARKHGEDLNQILANRGLSPGIWRIKHVARTPLGSLLICYLRPEGKLEPYLHANTLRHMGAVLGQPVYTFQGPRTGSGYVLITQPVHEGHLPLPLPEAQPGLLQLGVRKNAQAEAVALRWQEFHHLAVAGITGSGKSSLLRSIACQALSTGCRLAVADPGRNTFPMLAGHPGLLREIGASGADALEIVSGLLALCEARAGKYSALHSRGHFPDNLEEYNALAPGLGLKPLPRVVLILDEYNDLLAESGGVSGGLSAAAIRLARIGRKFGINLVFAAQDFDADEIGKLRRQVGLFVCFKTRSRQTARQMGCEPAGRLSSTIPGLAYIDRFGWTQTYLVDKGRLQAGVPESESDPARPAETSIKLGYTQSIPETPAAPLTALQEQIVLYALDQLDGRFIVNRLANAFYQQAPFRMGPNGEATPVTFPQMRNWAQELEAQALLTHPQHATDSRRVTTRLMRLVGR